MYKLEFTLKQHTPLIHFQHDQDGATLRASEVKPKLDKFIYNKWLQEENGNKEEVFKKYRHLTVGYTKDEFKKEVEAFKRLNPAEKTSFLENFKWALNYKMRIECNNPININLPIKKVEKDGIVQVDEIGRVLFTTSNYPDNTNSLIMGNMGGRIEENVLNFVLFINTNINIISTSNALIDKIKDTIPSFFVENNFGNRTSKGFGSYTVDRINGEECENDFMGDWILSFSIRAKDDNSINSNKAYKDIFVAINKIWKGLKRYGKSNKDGLKSVFLGRHNKLTSNEERIPSPLIFKLIIESKSNNEWDVLILVILNQNRINKAGADIEDFYDLIDNAIDDFNLDKEYNNNYTISNITIK